MTLTKAASRRFTKSVKDELAASSDGLRGAAGQAGRVITVVVVGVVSLIGILIYDQVFTAIPKDQLYNDPTNETNATTLGNAAEGINSGFGGAMELIPVVLIVLVAAVVIGIVSRLR